MTGSSNSPRPSMASPIRLMPAARGKWLPGGAKMAAGRGEDGCRHLEQQLPAYFLAGYDSRRLRNTQRYLLALARRTELVHVDPVRDWVRAMQVLLHEERLLDLLKRPLFTAEQRQLAEDFREMVEEFRVSLFDQITYGPMCKIATCKEESF